MRLEIHLYAIYFLTYLNQNDQAMANPMFGPNIRNSREGEFPFVVSLSRTGPVYRRLTPATAHICTGALITRKDVLIAAHCFEEANHNNAIVLVGSVDLSTCARYAIAWWITYNNWIEARRERLKYNVNDIGNIRVPESVTIGILSYAPIPEIYDKDVTIAAWGRNEEDEVLEVMRTVELKVLEINDCRQVLWQLNGSPIRIHNRHICSYAIPHAVMNSGDSGAPILLDGLIVAIHKSTMPFPNEFSNPRKINIHTTIDYYREFITSVIDSNINWGELIN